MVRKRTASDMEQLQTGAGEYHQRLIRRPLPLEVAGRFSGLETSTAADNNNVNNNNIRIINSVKVDHPANHSTMTLPSSINMSLSTTTATCSTNKNNSPPLCVFSGLPLFPPDKNYSSSSTTTNPNAGMSFLTGGGSNVNVNGMSADDSTTAAAWIDSIIKDLINSSTDVSIPHLIHNVREIIHPCNPSLATLLEYRLRSLTDPPPSLIDQPPVHDPSDSYNRVLMRGKEVQQPRNNPGWKACFRLLTRIYN
ncbi:hypothetical protein HanIR_Chr11g0534851 [Helianthus annuus]|nr:hypothetical protein HanIR_Chr11g0534851 [Helianthus annuus]